MSGQFTKEPPSKYFSNHVEQRNESPHLIDFWFHTPDAPSEHRQPRHKRKLRKIPLLHASAAGANLANEFFLAHLISSFAH
jgi:hypothetical protein